MSTEMNHTMSPAITSPGVTRAEAEYIINSHAVHCSYRELETEKRLNQLEGRFMLLCGFMAGSGFIGGATGAAMIKILGG